MQWPCAPQTSTLIFAPEHFLAIPLWQQDAGLSLPKQRLSDQLSANHCLGPKRIARIWLLEATAECVVVLKIDQIPPLPKFLLVSVGVLKCLKQVLAGH